MKLLKTYILLPVLLAAFVADADEMVIVSHDKYLPFSEELAQLHRQYQEMDVKIMTQDEFLATTVDQNSVFVGNGKSFLLFYGDATLQLTEIDAGGDRFISDMFWLTGVPESILKYKLGEAVTGRIPCRRMEDAVAYNKKVRAYFEDLPYKLSCGNCLLVADEDARHEHQRNSEELAAAIGDVAYAHVRKVYLDHYDNSVNRGGYALDAMSGALHEGVALMCYAGHGTVSDITTPLMLDNHRAMSLRNGVQPVMFFNACEVGRFSYSENVIAQNLLFNPYGGGIAVISPSKKTLAGYNQRLAQNFVEEWKLRKPGVTWGELWTTARNMVLENAWLSLNDVLAVNTASYNYLGDPALPVYYPDDIIPSINIDGKAVEDGIIELTTCRNHRISISDEGVMVMKVYGEPRTIAGVEYDDNVLTTVMTDDKDGVFEFGLNLPSFSVGAGRMEVTTVGKGIVRHGGYDVIISENTGEVEEPAVPEITEFAVNCDSRECWSLTSTIRGNVPSIARITVDGRSVQRRIDLTATGGELHYAIGRLGAGLHEVRMTVGGAEVSETVNVDSVTCRLELVSDKEVARGVLEVRIEGDRSRFHDGRFLVVSSTGETLHSRTLTVDDGDVIEWNLCDLSGKPVNNGLHEMYLIYRFADRTGGLYYGATDKVPVIVIH